MQPGLCFYPKFLSRYSFKSTGSRHRRQTKYSATIRARSSLQRLRLFHRGQFAVSSPRGDVELQLEVQLERCSVLMPLIYIYIYENSSSARSKHVSVLCFALSNSLSNRQVCRDPSLFDHSSNRSLILFAARTNLFVQDRRRSYFLNIILKAPL